MRKRFTILMFLLFTVSIGFAQQIISGQVRELTTGESLPMAAVKRAGSTAGTLTDINGNYSIQIQSVNDVLEFSYLGYITQKIKVGNQQTVNVSLDADNQLLEGVIVTAIGIKAEKKSIGYAAQQVGGDDLSNSKTSNIVNALSSKVAGVEVISSSGTPGASSSIVIRGRSSLRASGNSPLFVVDGVPIDNSYDGSYVYDFSNRAIDLNSDDIESVTVLKGAAASALYGIRAANGAILVTTKSGKSQKGVKKSITFKTSLGIDQINKLPEKQTLFSQGANGNYSGTSNTSWGALIDTLRYDGSPNNPKDRNGNIVGKRDPAAKDKIVNAYPIDNFFETAVTSNSYLSMSGNSDYGSYFFSVGHLDQSGVVPNSKFIRTTVKISGDSKLTDKLKISGTATYSNLYTGSL